ncbi:MAG: zinc ribbon domain-containing protein [Chloroflexi bacterium]|nr:MAG: zinc ribbon domain-containing protein [Chloroflexota bacterium]
MPIYEYECLTCGTTFEKRQSFSEEPIAACPNGHPETRRLLSAPAIVFKGSGFYINDSKSSKNGINGTGKSARAEKPGKKDTDSNKPETKSEKKAETN